MRQTSKLTAKAVENARPGKYCDGGGLWLYVSGTGCRSWVLRYMVNRQAREMGLGNTALVSLKEAREAALNARKAIHGGRDPIGERQAEQRRGKSFKQAASEFMALNESAWGNAKHREQWMRTLANYAYPVIGEQLVARITSAHILQILSPIWADRTETAKRLQLRISRVFDFAKSHGHCDGNPADWETLKHSLPRPEAVARSEHHEALPYGEVPALMARLAESDRLSVKALRFLILTAARSNEVREARWSEIDMAAKVWTIPGARMKMGKDHRVPLSDAALAILASIARQGELVFGGAKGKAFGKDAMRRELLELGIEVTVHGFRSSFRDWAGETTNHPREVAEMALAHQVGNDVERAYARSDLFARRAGLMADWASFLPCRAAGRCDPASRYCLRPSRWRHAVKDCGVI